MNVHTYLSNSSVEEIRETCASTSIEAYVGMLHISGDFNLGCILRSANSFGFRKMFYVGGKKSYDRRSTVGTHHYTPLEFIRTEEEFIDSVKGKYFLISIENNTKDYYKCYSLFDNDVFLYFNGLPPLFLFGEEQRGIPESILTISDRIITIPSFGSVRSLNVASCASIVFAFYRKFLESKYDNFEK